MDNIHAGDNKLLNQGDNLKQTSHQASSSALNEVFQMGSLVSDRYGKDTASQHLAAIDIWEGIPSSKEKSSDEKQQKKNKYGDDATELERMLRENDLEYQIEQMMDDDSQKQSKKSVLKAR